MNAKLTILALLSLFLISCGGGGGSSNSNKDNNNNNNNEATPPQLIQVATQTLVVGSAANITIINTGGQLGQCTIDPELPDNLNLAVSDNNCQITGVATTKTATITHTITASNNAGESTSNFALVVKEEGTILTDIPITSINISGNNTIAIGSATTLSATITPNDATNQNLNWSSSNEELATVNNTGLVTALNPGEVTITTAATDGSGASYKFVIAIGNSPTITDFTTTFLIDAVNIGDTIGTITITNSPTTVTILEDPNGYDQHFNINANGKLTVAQKLLPITYTLQVQATNDFGTTIGNLTITAYEIKELAKLIANDSANENRFGTAVAIYNDYMLIGAPGNSSANIPGYAYLFKINETTKEVTQLAKLIAADGRNNDYFGRSVALNDNYALVGAYGHDHSNLSNNGAVYLFDITNITPNTIITHTTKLIANDGANNDYFGGSVALNDNYALIGADQHKHSNLSNNGAAYLFDITNITPNTIITHTTKLIANDGGPSDYFGISVALNNNYALIGAYQHDHSNLFNNGAAYLFDITNITPNTIITHTTKLVANDGGDDDLFGRSVALNDNYALIGADFHSHSNLFGSGAAYLFAITNITPNTIITHTTKLIANDGEISDSFGRSVALNDNYALIGTDFHSHSNLFDNGAAYLFSITNITPNTTITHTTKLVANDGNNDDRFGISVALNNDYALIGAYFDNHSNLSNNGAAYVFGTSEALTIPVYNINIRGNNTITASNTTQLTTTIIPETATKQNLTWSSSDEAVATVTDGLVTALRVGTVTITATAQDNSGAQDSILITVQAEEVLVTEISIDGTNTITVGDTTQLTTVVTPNDATNQNLNWSSSNEEVATVTNGVVTALSVGTATITATATDGSSITASINITATPIHITAINISGNNTIAIGSATTLSATITPNDATNQNLNWSSSNEEVATVTNGLVTALNAGTATITATATDGSGLSAEFVMAIGNPPTITEFTTTFLIDTVNIGDTIGTITITNSPTIVTILADPNGYDQHFNIDANGRLTIAQQLLTITYTLEVQATNDFGTAIGNLTITVYGINQLAKLIATDSTNENRFGTAVAIYNDYMLIGASGGISANIPGYAYLFKVNEITREVTQLAKLIAADGANGDQFGFSVALNNNYALIGAYRHNHSRLFDNGAAYLFDITNITPNTTITHTTKLIANDGRLSDYFGASVALNNNYALIGSTEHDHNNLTDNGAAYLFDITNIVPNTTIAHTTKLVANDGNDYDYFSVSVALNNNYALIGAYYHDHSNLANNGAAYLFDITNVVLNTTITHTTKLVANDGNDYDYFSVSVALNNNYALIGATEHDHSNLSNNGAAYLFDITNVVLNTTITHTTKLVANDGSDDDNFGTSVALNNNYALIGAYLHSHSGLSDNGAAYLFDITNIVPNTIITHTTKLVANDGSSDDYFGRSIALNNNYALIGADGHDHSGSTDNGAAYVFDLSPTD